MPSETCFTCRHWRISEKDRAGRLKLTAMAAHGFGKCMNIGEWHYTGYRKHWHDWQQASEKVMQRRAEEWERRV